MVWPSIDSGAPGEQGHISAARAGFHLSQAKARPAAYLLDREGSVGRLYDARTTPHMDVVSKAASSSIGTAIA